MKKSILLIAILIIMTGCASRDPWTRKDTYRHAVMTGLMAIDWQQTKEADKNPDKYREINPLIWDTDWYFGCSWLFKTGVTRALPAKYRPWWQYVCIGTSAGCVATNWTVGLHGEW